MLSTASSHHLWGNIGYRHSAYFRFMNLVGYTYADLGRNLDEADCERPLEDPRKARMAVDDL